MHAALTQHNDGSLWQCHSDGQAECGLGLQSVRALLDAVLALEGCHDQVCQQPLLSWLLSRLVGLSTDQLHALSSRPDV